MEVISTTEGIIMQGDIVGVEVGHIGDAHRQVGALPCFERDARWVDRKGCLRLRPGDG